MQIRLFCNLLFNINQIIEQNTKLYRPNNKQIKISKVHILESDEW